MAELKWEKEDDLYSAETEFPSGCYVIRRDFNDTFDAELQSGDMDMIDTVGEGFKTAKKAKSACQTDYDARVAKIAAANGYVRVQPDEIVVKLAESDGVLEQVWQQAEMLYGRDEEGGVHCGQTAEYLTSLVQHEKRIRAVLETNL